MATNKYDVFISYSRIDYKDSNNEPIPNNVISKIISAFKKNHISYWIDENGIYTGDNFAPKIAEAIKNSSVFVFVSTENSNSSQWTQNEVCVAQKLKKPILPIKCDDSDYATSVIMYLAMLDYCDYKNLSDKAIQQLVESVKEKLPHDVESNNNVRSGNDEKYKETIISSLTEINHQFVDISQIAVSQVLEANERSREAIEELCKIVDGSSNEILDRFRDFQGEMHSHLSHTEDVLNENSLRICSRLEELIKISSETNKYIEEVCYFLKTQSNLVETSCSQQLIANLIFVIDTSGSMQGDRIDELNLVMNDLVTKFYQLFRVKNDVKIRMSVMTFSSEVKWVYDIFLERDYYNEWKSIDASGLTGFGGALDELRSHLSFSNGILSDLDNAFPPLIIFVSDGAPTDNWEVSLKKIQKNDNFHKSCKRVIAIGNDAPFDILSQLSFHNIIKVTRKKDLGYAVYSIIKEYLNEINSGRMSLIN